MACVTWIDVNGTEIIEPIPLPPAYNPPSSETIALTDRPAGTWFGYSVAASDTYVVIGHPNDSVNVVGSAHVYDHTGTLVKTVTYSPSNFNDDLGESVDVYGDYVVAGESNFDLAHLYDLTDEGSTIDPVRTFNADQTPYGAGSVDMGFSVGINADYVLAGAPLEDTQIFNGGCVHIFNKSGGHYNTLFPSTPVSGGRFGYSMDVSEDTVVVGARDAEIVDVFTISTGALVRTFTNPGSSLSFGGGENAVGIDGDYVVIGAYDDYGTNANVYVYKVSDGSLVTTIPMPSGSSEGFGWSVAIKGSIVAVGAPWDYTTGTTNGRVYVYDALTGDLLETVSYPTPYSSSGSNDFYGYDVALGGEVLVAGSHKDDTGGSDQGIAFIFK